jgi:thioesterase domain-containing protein
LIDMDEAVRAMPSHDPGVPIDEAAPACLLYTSGSTGLPKGVVLTHGNLLHRIRAYADVFQLRRSDRLTLLAPCAVAQGLSSSLQALLNGASVHPFDLRSLGVGELGPWLRARGITIFVCTASTFRHFARTLAPDEVFPAVRAVRLGSEEIFPHDVELYRRHFAPGSALVASLGSTEAGAIAINVIRHESAIADFVPAGYPAAGATIRILDDAGCECPPGMAGEITVHSPYVSPGYWRDPAQTAGAFVDEPGADGRTFFRTGDLGAMQPDGCVEFKGRKNLCVKIRGFRVELEEIERSLCAHPLVHEAIVVVRRGSGDDLTLAACLVSRTGDPVTAHQMRAHLEQALPDYMIPSVFEFLPALPRTASGKADRMALSRPGTFGPAIDAGARRASDPVESRLAALWEDLLGFGPIGVADDFFECGGNSLLAARLGASIERAFGTKLPLATFLKHATIEQQARLLREPRAEAQWSSIVPIQTRGSKPPLFCVHLVDGNVLSYRDLIGYLPADQPIYGLQSRGLDRKSPITTRIEDMARDYVAEIQRLYPSGPFGLCGWSFGGIVAFEMARQLEREGRPAALLALLDSRVRRAERSRRLVSRMPSHVNALLEGRARWSRKLRTARQILGNAIWRKLVLWHRAGGWLPRVMQNVTQANRNARRDYVPRPYAGPVTLFRVVHTPDSRRPDPQLEWVPLSLGGLEIHEVPGTHRTMVFEPHVKTLAAKLTECLENAWIRADSSSGTVSGGGKAA